MMGNVSFFRAIKEVESTLPQQRKNVIGDAKKTYFLTKYFHQAIIIPGKINFSF